MKAGKNFNIENGMALISGSTWYKVSDSFYTGTTWKTVTINLTESNKYYSNVSTALAKGVSQIGFNKAKGTSYIYVDNVVLHTELFSENRAEQAKPDAPVVESFTGSSITLKAVENALYSKDGGATWQASNTFTGLKAATDYSFVLKLKQSADFFESPVSDATIGTTAFVYKWNLYSDYFTIGSGATLKGGFNTTYKNEGTWLVSQNNQVGDTATLTSKQTVAPGIYSANLWARSSGARASIDIYVNDVKVKSALNTYTNKGNDVAFALDENTITIEEESTVTLTITTTTTGNLYLNALELAKIGDVVQKPIYKVTIGGVEEEYKEDTKIVLPSLETGYHYTDGVNNYNPGDVYVVTGEATLTAELNSYDVTIDGAVVASVAHGGTYTVQTPATGYDYTDGTTTYVGGEVITVTAPVALTSVVKTTKVVYTMDEGAKLWGKTNGFNEAVVKDVNGNNKLALQAVSDAWSYFALPEGWAAKPYYKPTKITYTATASNSEVKGYKFVTFSKDAMTGLTGTAPYHSIFDATKAGTTLGLPANITVDVTEPMYEYRYFSGHMYGGDRNSTSDFIYIDDVTIEYVYDFNYTPSIDVTMVEGAGVRFNQVNGLRFRANVDKAALQNFVANGYTVTMGTLIAPADYYASYTDMTLDTDKKILNVVTTSFYNEEAGTIAGSIGKIKDENIGRNFIARAYVMVEKDGETLVFYADDNDNTRSLKQVSISALEDDTADYTQEQRDFLDTWSKANDWA